MSFQDLLEEWHHLLGLGLAVLALALACALGLPPLSLLQPVHHSLPEGHRTSEPRRHRLPGRRVFLVLPQLFRPAAEMLLDLLAKVLDQRHHPRVPKVHLDADCKLRRRQCHQMLQALLDLVDLVHDFLGHRHLGFGERLPLDHGPNHGSRRLRDQS